MKMKMFTLLKLAYFKTKKTFQSLKSLSWCGLGDSNSWPLPWQGSALTTDLDVVGGVAGLGVVAQRVVEHACHAVKADGRAVQGGEVELVHGFLILEDQAMECARAR